MLKAKDFAVVQRLSICATAGGVDSDCGLETKTLCAARYGQKKANGILQMTYVKQLDNLKNEQIPCKTKSRRNRQPE